MYKTEKQKKRKHRNETQNSFDTNIKTKGSLTHAQLLEDNES